VTDRELREVTGDDTHCTREPCKQPRPGLTSRLQLNFGQKWKMVDERPGFSGLNLIALVRIEEEISCSWP